MRRNKKSAPATVLAAGALMLLPLCRFVCKRKKARPQLIVSQLQAGLSDGSKYCSHTDAQSLHGKALVANEVIIRSVVLYGGPGPVGNIVIFVRHQSLNVAATIVVVPLRRPVLPSGSLPQTADLRNGPGQIGYVLLHICQLVRDTPQFLSKKELFAIGKINVEAAQIIVLRVGREFEKLRNVPVQLDRLRKRRL